MSILSKTAPFLPNLTNISKTQLSRSSTIHFPVTVFTSSRPKFTLTLSHSLSSSSPEIDSDISSGVSVQSPTRPEIFENLIEQAIYRFRFMALLGVSGSLVGSLLCFIKGCNFVGTSFMEYFFNRGKVIMLLVEAIDVYLLGTVMLVFGMGLYELFVSNLDIGKSQPDGKIPNKSNFFGLFTLMERPKWLEVASVNELKTKLGHVIVMILLIGLLEKSKKAIIQTPFDLLCFSASVLLSSGSLYLLSKLHHD